MNADGLNGSDSSQPPQDSVCQRCHGAGWVKHEVEFGHPDFGEAFPCECTKATARIQRDVLNRQYCELPPLVRDMTFEGLVLRQDLTPGERRQFADVLHEATLFSQGCTTYKWLILGGSKGWGKTHLAVAILNYRLAHPDSPVGKYANWPELLGDLRKGFQDDTYADRLERYRQAPLLLLDDVGAQYEKRGDGLSWPMEQLYLLLNHRSLHQMETVVTINVEPTALNDRIADRLMDTGTGLCKVLTLTIPSYRSGRVW